jgi:TPR repeat protein
MGDAVAQCNLGARYDNDEGLERDMEEAVRHYRMAADKGNAVDQYLFDFRMMHFPTRP